MLTNRLAARPRSRARPVGKWMLAAVLCVMLSGQAQAVLLTDAELWFDPASIVDDYYVQIDLDDLTAQNTYLWAGSSDPVTTARILPVLRDNNYAPGYVFSQSDYYNAPNSDYFADLTSGDLTAQFLVPGLYHVAVQRQSGASDVFAVFAEAGLKGEPGKPDKTGANRKIDTPQGDLILVEQRDATMDKSAKVWEQDGRTTQRTTSRQDAIDKIKAKSEELGRKIHVELDGHGYSGYISIGGGWKKGADYFLDTSNAQAFQEAIDPYVNNITFQGCSTGAGADGVKLLEIMRSSIGMAGAWDQPVTVVAPKGTKPGYFTVPLNARFVVVPEPATVVALAYGLATMAYLSGSRRRRH